MDEFNFLFVFPNIKMNICVITHPLEFYLRHQENWIMIKEFVNDMSTLLSLKLLVCYTSSGTLLGSAGRNGSHGWHLQADSEGRLILVCAILMTSSYLTFSSYRHPHTHWDVYTHIPVIHVDSYCLLLLKTPTYQPTNLIAHILHCYLTSKSITAASQLYFQI